MTAPAANPILSDLDRTGGTANAPRAAGTAPGAPLRTELISDAESLTALRPIWDDLLERAGLDHPFLSHDWVSTWWGAFGGNRQLRVLAVFSGQTCIGIAPLMLERTWMYGIPVRRLSLLGNEHTPRSGFVVAERFDDVYAALLGAMNELGKSWDVLVLPQLADGSATLRHMEPLMRAAGRAGTWRAPGSPRLELRGTWAGYFNSLRSKQRTNLRNRINRLKSLGAVELEEVLGGEQLDAALDDGLRIEAAAWKGSAGTAIRSQPESNRFYRRFAKSAAARGWLCLHFLKVDGKRVAFSYGLRFRNNHYLVKQGYDPEYAAASPSHVLCSFMIENAFRRGEATFDFLGTEETWKSGWTQQTRAHAWLFLFQPRLRPWLIHFAKFRLLPALRKRIRRASR